MTKPILRALRGEAVWPPPMWLMRQAGRYLPEYRAVRARTDGFIDLCTTPALAAEVTLQPIHRFGFDAAILFSDILMLPWALGHGVRFEQGEGPVLDRVTGAAQVIALKDSRLKGAIAPILETVARVSAALDPHTTLIGFAGAPFTVACYMVEGGGSKDFEATRRMAFGDPALFTDLIHRLTDATIVYLTAQITAGAEVVMLFDSWAGVLAPSLFRAHVLKPAMRIVAALKAAHPTVPVIGFPRLAGMLLGQYAGRTGVDAVGMDSSADPLMAASLVDDRVALQGNLDPMALLAGGPALDAEAESILVAMHGRPFVFNLGHGIVPQTPPEHVAALVRRVRAP